MPMPRGRSNPIGAAWGPRACARVAVNPAAAILRLRHRRAWHRVNGEIKEIDNAAAARTR